MLGDYSPYIPGWDTHGLPIEYALLKMGINNNPDLSISEKRKNCRNFALQQVELQKQGFSRLGLLTDFNDIYLTLDRDFEVRELQLFSLMIKNNLIYQDLKPVY